MLSLAIAKSTKMYVRIIKMSNPLAALARDPVNHYSANISILNSTKVEIEELPGGTGELHATNPIFKNPIMMMVINFTLRWHLIF